MTGYLRLILGLTILALLTGCASPSAATAVISPQELELRARDFLTRMEAGEYREARRGFTLSMKLALPQSKLEDLWAALQQQAGDFVQQGEARIVTEQGYQIAYVTCRFGLSALDAKVVFDKKGKIAGLFFQPAKDSTAMAPEYLSPDYVATDSFREEEVVVGEGEWQLPGTLTLPLGSGPFPAVVLVHGSGPNDRDESIGPNKVFRDLAWGLASRGIAVLRYEKRTREHAEKFTPEVQRSLTVQEETVDDALAAVGLLQSRSEVDASRVYVLGHSLGATLAPRIAVQDARLAGIILLAAAARPIEDLVVEQSTYLANADGKLDRDEKKNLAVLEDYAAQIKELPDSKTVDSGNAILGAYPAYWIDLAAYDPVAVAETLTLPMLILQGERDYQVNMTDFSLWQKALGGRGNVVLKSYPALNHQFFAGEGPSLPAEYQEVRHVDAMVIEDITSFIEP